MAAKKVAAKRPGRTGTGACRKTSARRSARAHAAEKAPEMVVTETVAEKPPLRPSQCRGYMRQTLAREFRGIVDGFVKGARSGSCQHVKLATELLEPKARKPRKSSGRSTLERWVDELERGA